MSTRPRRRLGLLLGTALLLLAGGRVGGAQPTSTIKVNPAAVGPVTINTAVAGQEPTGVTAGGGSYDLALKKNGGLYTITARLNATLPPGTTLSITLADPAGGGQSVGPVLLNMSAQPVVTNLPSSKTNSTGNAISYSFTATSAAGVVALQTAIVTLELAP